jgi:hypothetical protein
MTLQDITLQSADGVLVATNENGHLTYPMLHLNRQPVPEDAAGFDRVLVFVDGDGTITVTPTIIELNEENNYFQSLYIQGEGQWSISGITTDFIQLDSSSGQLEGVGNARIDVTKAPTLTTPGGYTGQFIVTLANAEGTTRTILVFITVNLPMTVGGRGNGQTLTINLNAANNYTETLTIIRDREWQLENVDNSRITVSPTSGNGAELPDFASPLTVRVSPNLTTTTATTTFQVVSLFQRVNVTVNIVITITGEFVDPRFDEGEVGVTGDEAVYLYL